MIHVIIIYLWVSVFFAVAAVIDFTKKEAKGFSFKWSVLVFAYAFILWPYGVYRVVKSWKK